MEKFLKIFGIAAAILVGLVVAVFLVLKLISDNQYKEWITSGVKAATGRDLIIENLELDLNSSLLVKANDIHLANAAWGSQPDMLSIGQFEAELNLISLLVGVADIRTVIKTTNILAETHADNTSNWDFGTAPEEPGDEPEKETAAESDGGGLPIRPLIREFRIQDLALTLLNEAFDLQKSANVENLLIETTQDELTLELAGAYETTAIALTGNLGRLVEALEGASTPVALNGNVGKSTLDVTGKWGPLLPDLTADLKLAVHIPSTSDLSGIAGIELADLGKLELDATFSATGGGYAITDLDTTLEGEHAVVSVEGAIEDVVTLAGIKLKAQANTSALAALLKKFNIEVPVALPPDLKIIAQVSGNMEELGVKGIDIEARDEGIEIHVSGDVTHALEPEGVGAEFEVNVGSVAALSKYAGLDIPQLGELKISGEVSSVDKTYRLENLNARLSGEGTDLTVDGSIDDLIALGGIEANINTNIGTFSSATVAEIEKLLKQQSIDIPLLLPTSIKLSSHVAGSLEKLGVNGLEVEVLDKGMELTLSGAVADVLAPEGIDATLTFKAETLAALSKYTQPFVQFELPEQGALDLSGRVLSNNKTYRLQDFKASLSDDDFNVEIQASINDLLAVTGINADLKADVASLSALSDLAKTELPVTDAVNIIGKVSTGEGEQSKQTSVTLSAESNGATIKLDGNLADLQSVENIDVLITVTASSLSDFDKFAQTELPKQGPFNLRGTVHTATNEYRLEDFQMDLDEQSLNGSAGMKLAEDETGKSKIDAQLNIPLLNLSLLLAPKPDAQPTTDESEVAADAGLSTKETKEDEEIAVEVETEAVDRLFSTDPLPVEALHNYDADISIVADRLIWGKTSMTDVDVKLSLNDGLLQVDPIKATAGNGNIDGTFTLNAKTTPADLSIKVTIDDAPMPRLGGGLDFHLDVEGTGGSAAELMAGLNGQVLIVMRDGRLENSMMTDFGSGLLSSINPFAKKEPYTDIECGILRVEIEDGFANFERKMAMQTTKVTWRGGGDINLKTEELDVGILPKPRKGIPISAGSLASLVHVGGTLKNPKMQLDPKDVAMKYGKYMAAIGTGGLTFLAEMLINKSQANEDVCAKILDGTVFDEEGVAEEAASEAEPKEKVEQGATTEPAAQIQDSPETERAVEQETDIKEEVKKEDSAPKSKNEQ